MQQASSKASESMQRTAETMGDTIVDVLDRLAGTKTDLKLIFQDLTFDAGALHAKMSGAVILETTMAKEAEKTSM